MSTPGLTPPSGSWHRARLGRSGSALPAELDREGAGRRRAITMHKSARSVLVNCGPSVHTYRGAQAVQHSVCSPVRWDQKTDGSKTSEMESAIIETMKML